MPASFLHGVETIEIQKGARPVRMVKTAVIGLVGTAWSGPVNTPTLVLSEKDAAQFGDSRAYSIDGDTAASGTIASALKAIFDQGGAQVIVMNVQKRHNTNPKNFQSTTLAHSDFTIAPKTGEAYNTLNVNFISNLKIEHVISATEKVHVKEGSDFVYDTENKNIILLKDGDIGKPYSDTGFSPYVTLGSFYLSLSYECLDLASPNARAGNPDFIAGINKFKECYSKFGFFPKILIAPGNTDKDTDGDIAAKLVSVADNIRAIALLDGTPHTSGSTPTVGTLRGDQFFDTSSERAVYCYPYVNAGTAEKEDFQPYSQYLAGAMAAKDIDKGYWWSPSNTEIKGITGVAHQLTAMINDPSSDVNFLNSTGITTIFNSFGTGFRVWGNRSASYPASTAATNFINIRRTADIIHESVEYAMLQFIDMPINGALIDSIAETVNSFMRTLIGRGAIIDGKCVFDPAKNEATEMAAGHITFDIEFMPPAPAERISFESFININMLEKVGG